MQNYTFRLLPGQDLFDSLQAFVMKKHVTAEIVLAAFPMSFTNASLRKTQDMTNWRFTRPAPPAKSIRNHDLLGSVAAARLFPQFT
jgi:hypothetical protein